MLKSRPGLLAIVVAIAACSSGEGTSTGAIALAPAAGDAQSGLAGSALSLPLVVRVSQNGRATTYGKNVTWSVVSGGGSLSSQTSTVDYFGQSAVLFTLGPAFGPQSVRAVIDGVTNPVTFTATATGNLYTVTTVAGDSQVAAPLATLPVPLTVLVKDVNGVAAPGITVTWTVAAGGGTLSPGASVTGSDGRATTTFKLGPVNGPQLVRASVPGAFSTAAFTGIGTGTPDAPQLVAVVPMPTGATFHHDTFVRDGLAFVCAWNQGVLIYDVGNGMRGGSPSNPQLVSQLITSDNGVPGGPAVHNAWWFHNPVTGQNKYLFIGQEGPVATGSIASGDIHIVDVSNLAAPKEVGFIHIAGAGTHNFWMDEANQVLYAAYYNAGVVKIDVSGTLSGDMSNRVVARNAPGGPNNTFTWGVMLSGGTLYATDMLSGFWALDPVTLAVKGGGNNVPEREGSDQWVVGSVAYSGTWSCRTSNGCGNTVKIWSLAANGVPTLADSLFVPNVTTISDVAVTPDGKALVLTTEGGSGSGLYVYDRVNPFKPQLRGSTRVTTGLHTGEVATINGRTYVFAARDPVGPAMYIYDITGLVP
jgi:hypothetical protein